MTLRPCMVCGEPAATARCPQHQPRRHRPNSSARGYDTAWRNLSERARRLQPFCTDCGATRNLQGDHSPQAWDRKARGLPIRLADIDVVCRDCNIARGSARGHAPSHHVPDPMAKAKFESQIA